MDFLDKVEQVVSRIMSWMAGLFLVAMVLLTCADIFLRIVWVPIRGSVELVALFGSITTAFALGYTQMRRGHISVDVVVNFLPEKARNGLQALNAAVCCSFFAIASWRIAVWSTTIWRAGELTETLRISFYPFSYGVALGCAFLSLVFLLDLLRRLFPRKEGTQ